MITQPKIFGLIGKSISSSLSPVIFAYLFKKYKIKAEYHLFPLENNQLESALQGMRVLGISGINVTAPYKEEVTKFLDGLDGLAKEIGAVNLICNQNGKLKGFNTDWIGIKRTLQERLQLEESPEKIILIGAGGAARACLRAFKFFQPSQILIFNRSVEKAKTLAGSADSRTRVEVAELQKVERYIKENGISLVINATSGKHPIIKRGLLQALTKQAKVFDLNYNLDSVVNVRFRKQYSDGLYMLVCQAVETFRIWFQIEADPETLYRYLIRKRPS